LTSLISTIVSQKSIRVQREQIIVPLQKELLNAKIVQLERVKKDIREISNRKVDGISTVKGVEDIKDNIATIMAQGSHWLMNSFPDLIDEVFIICQNEELTSLQGKVKVVNDYKALLQAEYIYGATSDDRKFKKIQRKN